MKLRFPTSARNLPPLRCRDLDRLSCYIRLEICRLEIKSRKFESKTSLFCWREPVIRERTDLSFSIRLQPPQFSGITCANSARRLALNTAGWARETLCAWKSVIH